MDIVAALFLDDIATRQIPGPTTRLDLSGVQFSAPAPGPFPVTVTPHLVVIVRCAPDDVGTGALEVVFKRADEQIARNVQPLLVEPGKFSYRLVRAELDYPAADTVEAHCRVDTGPATIVPYTLLEPVDA